MADSKSPKPYDAADVYARDRASVCRGAPTLDHAADAEVDRASSHRRDAERRDVGGDTTLGETPVAPSVTPPLEAELAPQPRLVGLAFSGGGIRSATFGLGVLQRLASLGHMPQFDLLSTVSGGGYIGGWLSAWIQRDGFKTVVDELSKNPESHQIEPVQVQWLRRYSNYLTPRVGAMSLDALTVAATYLRNVLLNLVVLISATIVALLVPILLLGGMQYSLENPGVSAKVAAVFGGVGLIFTAAQLALSTVKRQSKWLSAPVAYGLVIVPCFVAAFFASAWLATTTLSRNEWATSASIGIAVILLATFAVSWWCKRPAAADAPAIPNVGEAGPFSYGLATLVCVPLAYLAFWGLHVLRGWGGQSTITGEMATSMLIFGPPVILSVAALAVTLWIGLMGRAYREMFREWWSRIGGAMIALCIGWVAWCFVAIDVPVYLGVWISAVGMGIGKIVAAGWIASLAAALTFLQRSSGPTKATRKLTNWGMIAAVLATVFMVGLIVAVACGIHALLHVLASSGPVLGIEELLIWIRRADVVQGSEATLAGMIAPAWFLLIVSTVIAVVFGWRVDINRFSLHDMYKNRLIRCYLGASNSERNPNPFTGFDPADDMALSDLATRSPKDVVADGKPGPNSAANEQQPQRPFHIFNTTLNLTHGSELSWQERKAASFVLTPTYSGFNLSPASGDKHLIAVGAAKAEPNTREQAYRPTALYADGGSNRRIHAGAEASNNPSTASGRVGFTIGMAIATSGAAASPNMGANSQPALAMLMTFFNIRLGRWSPNPAKKHWRRASPRSNLAWLFAEVTGNTSERSAFVYLSDGGHFENTGVYELARRGCSHIVMVDAGEDAGRTFADLGNLIRKCRVDLGAEIVIPLQELYALKTGLSDAGSVVGSITYDVNASHGCRSGKILLIKPTLGKKRTEPADIYNYAQEDQAFPQQTTLDQWFDESQFESYRFLGASLTEDACKRYSDFFS